MSATSSYETNISGCPICCESYLGPKSGPPIAGPCLHNICQNCFVSLRHKTCPFCCQSIATAIVNTDLVKIIEEVSALTLAPPKRLGPSPDDATLLPHVTENAKTFLTKTWAPDSTHANHLTPDNLDLLWKYDPELCEKVLLKLYDRLEIFYTEACTVSDNFNQSSADTVYKNLCRLGAVKTAADQGIDVAAFCQGYCFYHGIGCSKNPGNALHYFNLAAEQKLPLALFWLGRLHEAEGRYAPAFECYKTAAAQNNMDSFVSLAQCYFKGRGVEACPIKAIENLKIAAEQGHIDALTLLGDYYSQKDPSYSKGTAPDWQLAQEYYVRALSRGNERAHEEIHRCTHAQSARKSEFACTHQ